MASGANRYHIDDFQASGPVALALLAIVSVCCSSTPAKPGVEGLRRLIGELDEHIAKVPPRKGIAPPKSPIHFGAYFDPDERDDERRHFKHGPSQVYQVFLDFVAEKLASYSIVPDKEVAKKLVDRLIDDGSLRSVVAAFRDLLSEREGASMALAPILTWKSRRTGEGGADPRTKASSSATSMGTIGVLSEHALRVQFLGLSPNVNQSENGLFYVVREARGVFGRTPDRRNLIVRELLWIRDPDHERRDTKRDRSARLHDQSGLAKGYYFSAMDEGIYEVETADAAVDGQLQLMGRLMGERGDLAPHHFYLSTWRSRIGQGQSEPKAGLLAGSTRNAERPAAWKAIIARVDRNRDPDGQLELNLERISTQGPRVARANLVAALDYLQCSGLVGVLAWHGDPERGDPSRQGAQNLVSLRGALKRLLANSAKPLVDEMTTRLFEDLLDQKTKQLLAEIRSRGAADAAQVEALIGGILGSWAELEPLHLFIPNWLRDDQLDERTERRARRQAWLQQLIEAEPIAPAAVLASQDL